MNKPSVNNKPEGKYDAGSIDREENNKSREVARDYLSQPELFPSSEKTMLSLLGRSSNYNWRTYMTWRPKGEKGMRTG